MHLQGTAHTVLSADGSAEIGWVCLDPYGQWRASRKYGEYMGDTYPNREAAEQAVLDDHTPPKRKAKEAKK